MSSTERKKREKEQRRNLIIDAAEKLFFSRGYDEVTMDDVAQEAELSKALLYYYFKDKEALFFAVDLRGARILDSMYNKCFKLKTDGLTKLDALGMVFYEFSVSYPDYFRLYSYAGTERFRNTDNEDAREITRMGIENWHMICKTIRSGMQDGTIRKDIDPEEIAVFLTVANIAVLNLDPGWVQLFESKGIQKSDIWMNFRRFMIPAVTCKPEPYAEKVLEKTYCKPRRHEMKKKTFKNSVDAGEFGGQ